MDSDNQVFYEIVDNNSVPTNLREELIAAQIPSEFDSMRQFVPPDKLREIICKEDNIERELRTHGAEGLAQEELEFIRDWAAKTFATLVYLGMPQEIVKFLACDFSDEALPVEFDPALRRLGCPHRWGAKPLGAFASWNAMQILEFCDHQWRFNVFEIRQQPELSAFRLPVLPIQMIIPFSVRGKPKRTGFNQVSRVYLPWYPEQTWALKQSLGDVELIRQQIAASENYLREIQQMRKIRGFHLQILLQMACFDRYLIRFYSAFKRGNPLYILLPWADGGSLHDCLSSVDGRNVPNWWIREQNIALVGAVSLLHLFRCCHGDLKPDNILLFPKNPRENFTEILISMNMVIADFGLAHTYGDGTHSTVPQTGAIRGSPRYAPPEADESHPDFRTSLSAEYDIWALGCILLEIIVWAHGGNTAREQFNLAIGPHRVEKFWRAGQDGYEVHPVVKDCISQLKERLYQEGQSNPDAVYLYKILLKVEERMLVCDKTNRLSAGQLMVELIGEGAGPHWRDLLLRMLCGVEAHTAGGNNVTDAELANKFSCRVTRELESLRGSGSESD